MKTITLNSAAAEVFARATCPVEVCNEKGELIGVFRPSPGAKVDPRDLIDDEELKRRAAQKGPVFTTAEVLAYLETL